MLDSYIAQTQRLIQNPAAPISLYNPADLTVYINEARVQLAGEAACIRVMGNLSLAAGVNGPYSFGAINLSGAIGVQGVLSVQTMWYVVGSGQKWVRPRPFPWFSLYELNTPVPQQRPPRVWSQYGQGVNGTVYFNTPDLNYIVNVDTICYPIDLQDDATPEAVPPLWQTAVKYYAAYLALLSSQTSARMAEAEKMLQAFELFVARARKFTTPLVSPTIYQQVPSPVQDNQLGLQGKSAQQGGG